MIQAKVEPFGEPQSWALLSTAFHFSPPADLPTVLPFFAYGFLRPGRSPTCRSRSLWMWVLFAARAPQRMDLSEAGERQTQIEILLQGGPTILMARATCSP